MSGRRGRPVLRHIGAMHLSGFVLLCSFVVPPLRVVEMAYATPPDDPTADNPGFAWLAALAMLLLLHVAVQVPAGLLGAWLGRGTWGRYGVALAVAAPLTLLIAWGETDMWLDALTRTALGLGAYAWVLTGAAGRAWRGH
ncbi:hypothetical protein ACFWN1_02940 [Streptomyces sp. NPDC058459]|uniref:hypothetical protein n=1 Tax=Streptomyces sp. NPDC058459 TaxID=3346508 RepID=UPI0036688A38